MKSAAPRVLSPKPIFLGVKGSVIALDANTGGQLWVTHLKGSGFVHLVLDGGNLYATTYGEIFCLDPRTGAGRWHNPLKGFGLGLVSVATGGVPSSGLLPLAAERRRQEEEAAAGSSAATAS
ncbi:MAG TPA: PQQ-binding-like beta-propeller repeat protein [Verrucomicrobiae bacterium]